MTELIHRCSSLYNCNIAAVFQPLSTRRERNLSIQPRDERKPT